MKCTPRDVEAIRREMATIRRRHHDDIAEIISEADALVGWGRNIRSYAWPTFCATALSWIVAHWRSMFAMKRTRRKIAAKDNEVINDRQTTGVTGSAIRPAWLGEVATLLTPVAIRAAQHYAAYCLLDRIAPRGVARSSQRGCDQGRLCDESSKPNSDCIPTERLAGACEEIESICVGGGSKESG